jgi:hypothetical protein
MCLLPRHNPVRAAIPERSVHATFARKFNGISGNAYLTLTRDQAAVLTEVVARLRKARLTGAPAALVYDDLKPEHAMFPDGSDGRPAFLDPGMSLGQPETDLGKLFSRLVLGLVAALPQGPGRRPSSAASASSPTRPATAWSGRRGRRGYGS